jgi:hypothetical protein
MKISTLLEASADDLFRKIDACQALINDKGAPDGEKESARRALQRLQDKLNQEFPGAVRSNKPKNNDDLNPFHGMDMSGFWGDIYASYEAHRKQQERYAADPDAERQDNIEKIERLKQKRKHLKPSAQMGNVYAIDEIKHINAELESLMAKWQPEEYAVLLKKRDASNDRGYEKRYEQNKAKAAAEKEALKTSGKSTISKLKKIYAKEVAELSKAMKGAIIGGYYRSAWEDKGDTRQYFVNYLPDFKVSDIRTAYNKLSPETQTKLREMAEQVTNIGRENRWTDAQKKKVLSAFAPPADSADVAYEKLKQAEASGARTFVQTIAENIDVIVLANKFFKYKKKDPATARAVLSHIAYYVEKMSGYHYEEDLAKIRKLYKGADLTKLISDLQDTLDVGSPSSNKVLSPKNKKALVDFFNSCQA